MPARRALVLLLSLSTVAMAQQTPAYLDEQLPFERRAEDLVSRMTLAEKVSQMMDQAAAIPRLGVPAYGWWNEALHGVAFAGLATSFPQAIGIAATWDRPLVHRMATAISDEARAKYHEDVRNDVHDRFHGLTFWSPNINLFRDPRWGRGQETYGEDPFLTGTLATQFVRGMQGDDPKYLKTVSTVKHYVVHSGPEPARHTFDARPSERDFRESYLPHFMMGIRDGGAYSLMCAYNRVYGTPACGSTLLLHDILRGEWGFNGYVVSDCDAVSDMYKGHKTSPDAAAAAAAAVKAGTDLDCGTTYKALVEAVARGLITKKEIDVSVTRLMLARMKLGMFDSSARVRWASTPIGDIDAPVHRELARQVARESMVLLRNDGNVLPLRKDLGTIAVIGPNADQKRVQLGNYNGSPSDTVTPLRGIREAVSPATKVLYALGSSLAPKVGAYEGAPTNDDSLVAQAENVAKQADAVVLVLGLTPNLEGEEMRVDVPGFKGGDRTSIDLPAPQRTLMERIVALGKPTVLVLLNGSALAIDWAQEHVPAIVDAWYPGQAGNAVADVLFGDYNPAGRLPVTFYRSTADLPPFEDYGMAGRTYRFFTGTPLYPFGYGLSYTTFRYANLRTSAASMGAADTMTVSVDVTNSGARGGDEVVQFYVKHLGSAVTRPLKDLRGYARVHLAPGQTRTVSIPLMASSLAYWDVASHAWRVEDEDVEVQVGASSADVRLKTTVHVR